MHNTCLLSSQSFKDLKKYFVSAQNTIWKSLSATSTSNRAEVHQLQPFLQVTFKFILLSFKYFAKKIDKWTRTVGHKRQAINFKVSKLADMNDKQNQPSWMTPLLCRTDQPWCFISEQNTVCSSWSASEHLNCWFTELTAPSRYLRGYIVSLWLQHPRFSTVAHFFQLIFC